MIFYFCLKFCPPVLAFIHEFSCSSSKVLLISSHLYKFSRKKIYHFSLIVCLFISVYHMDIFSMLLLCVFCYLSCPNFWPSGNSYRFASWGFKTCFHFHPQNSPVFKFSDSMRLSKCILHFHFPSLGSTSF